MAKRPSRTISRGGRRPGRPANLSRDTILSAARREFAAHGYAGAGVDRIARNARVNKAMIYYHFRSKAGLYHAILGDMFETTGERTAAIAAGKELPEEKLDRIVETITGRLATHPELPPIMMREMAEGGRHLNPTMLKAMSVLFRSVADVVEEGRSSGRFHPMSPLFVYFTMVGPLVLFLAGAPLRDAMSRLKVAGEWNPGLADLRAHVQTVLRRLLLKPERNA